MSDNLRDDCSVWPTTNGALLLVDLQNDFVEGGSLAVSGGRDVIRIANALMPKFRLVVATQDWHPADHQSFASQHAGVEIGSQFMLDGLLQTAWPEHCVQGTFGAEFVSDLNLDMIDHIVRKGTDRDIDSYSGFYDNGHKISTGLADYLRQQNIDSLFVMGLATDYCVRATVLDAVAEGFSTNLILAGCRGVELHEGDIATALSSMQTAGALLV